jgi:hypothetical protein
MGLARNVGGCPAPPSAKKKITNLQASAIYMFNVCSEDNEIIVYLDIR